MTVVQPNSISGINSITVQSGQSLSVHQSDGTLIREIVSATGVGTFYAIAVGTAATVQNNGAAAFAGIVTANGGVKVGAAASIYSNGNATFSGIVTTAQLGGDVLIEDKIVHVGDTNTAIRFPSADTFSTETGGSEALRVDSSQRLLVGSTSSRIAGDVSAQLQVEGTSYHTSSLALIANSGASAGNNSHITLAKSRGSSDGSDTILADDDSIGIIQWAASDGTDLNCVAANIRARVDGTPGSNDMPGRIEFGTTADGAVAPTERLRITSAGRVGIAEDDPDTTLHVKVTSTEGIRLERNGGTVAEWVNDTDLTTFGTTTNHNVAFKTNGTERMRVTNGGLDPTTDAATDLGTSSKRFRDLYLSSGVFLGGTTSANELTDYEEGTFTLILSDTGGNNPTSGGSMNYTKIGRWVNCWGQVSMGNASSAIGGAHCALNGWPFSTGSHSSNDIPVWIWNNGTDIYEDGWASVSTDTGSTVWGLYIHQHGGAPSITGTMMGSSPTVSLGFSYQM